MSKTQGLCILGSTGSIGEATLEIVRRFPQHFKVVALGAGKNAKALREQIREFKPEVAVIGGAKSVPDELSDAGCEVIPGMEALCTVASRGDVDTVVAAIVGMQGLPSVHAAISSGKKVCLANKESLVCAGELLSKLAQHNSVRIVPVDSEHCSVFQCLENVKREDVSSIVLTASGGPFLDLPIDKLWDVTPEQAANHPKWKMGSKISIDSSTMVNKALEIIEAHWLFGGIPVEVLVHPESIIHGMVKLVDGTELCHMAEPDMKAPIAFSLSYPEGPRFHSVVKNLSLPTVGTLSFRQLDESRFEAVSLARSALSDGGASPAIFNIGNEIAVSLFEMGKIRYPEILSVISSYLESFAGNRYSNIGDLFAFKSELEERAESVAKIISSTRRR